MNITLEIQNLKCGGCANTIKNKVSSLDISDIEIIPDDNTISFSYNNTATLTEAKTLLAKIGYPVIGEKNPLSTKAKSFVSCAVGRMSKD